MHRLLLHNDDILDTQQKSLSAGQVGLLNGWGVFSTIRVADGVLFAFERHWERMHTDARRLHVPFPASPDWLKSRLLRLAEANKVRNGTLRVAVIRNHGGLFEGPGIARDFDVIAFTTDLHHWSESVRLSIKPHGRHAQSEFAGAKITSWAQNLTWYEEAHQRGFDEVVLLNERGEVSECTSANIFALQGSQVATPPLNSGCLPGITRQLLLEEIRVPGITVVEQTLMPADLQEANQVFITSSTRDLLAVAEIEGFRVKSEGLAVVSALVKAFGEYRDAYVKQSAAKRLDKVTA
ncbi:MAG TPA: aminotransferase class IV [Bryobacteraceae bacterium]|nr:aminotransferase class IV [Bryobacteraceae bacterium]